MVAPPSLALPFAAFCPSRFAAARQRRGLGVAELAGLIGVHRHAIARYEAGQFVPSPEHLRAAAKVLKFPERFFHGDDICTIKHAVHSFRAGSNLPTCMRDMALGAAAVAVSFNRDAERFFSLPEVKLPDYSGRDPERAAELLRGRWELGSQPIGALMSLLEEKGIRIFSLPSDMSVTDTFSFWHGRTPFIFLMGDQPPNAMRADLARELAHLVLHRNSETASKIAHEKAKVFAEAFMLPASASGKIRDVSEVSQLAPAAAHFGAPPIMLARRLHHLGVLSEWKFRALRTELEQQAGINHILSMVYVEKSVILPRIFSSLRARGVTKHRLAHVVHIYPTDLDELTFGIASDSLRVGRAGASSGNHLRPKLVLVGPEQQR
jgi:Zn-dependent peptidase ImmA (M78 family)/DNA-binding XRE family transcriptional regulator